MDDGSTNPELDPKLSPSDAVRLYRLMLMERILDTRMLALQRQGRIGFYGPSVGQEATIVAPALALESGDWVFPQYREPGAALARGMPLLDLVNQFMGNAADAVHGRQMPCHYVFRRGNYMSISSCVGTQIPLAVGAAWAAKLRGDRVVTLVYFGDGGTSTSDFHSGMNFAGVFRTPTVFVCNNNQWAISLPVARHPGGGGGGGARGAGAPRGGPPAPADRHPLRGRVRGDAAAPRGGTRGPEAGPGALRCPRSVPPRSHRPGSPRWTAASRRPM